MSDRLAELRRQRELIQEHLVWLDREIAEAIGKKQPATLQTAAQTPAFPAATVAAAPNTKHSAPAPASETPAIATAADAILEDYRVSPDALKTDVRKGCLLYFAAALALVGLLVAVLYFALRQT